MDDKRLGDALDQEAAALDRQLVDYVVAKLAKDRIAGPITLSKEVTQAINAGFVSAAAEQSATIAAIFAEQRRALVEALDAHRRSITSATPLGDDYSPGQGPESSDAHQRGGIAGDENNRHWRDVRPDKPNRPAKGALTLEFWLWGVLGIFLIVVGAGGALIYQSSSRPPVVNLACIQIEAARRDIGQIVQDIDAVAASEEFRKQRSARDARPVRNATDGQLRPSDLGEQMMSALVTTRERLATLRDRPGSGCQAASTSQNDGR